MDPFDGFSFGNDGTGWNDGNDFGTGFSASLGADPFARPPSMDFLDPFGQEVDDRTTFYSQTMEERPTLYQPAVDDRTSMYLQNFFHQRTPSQPSVPAHSRKQQTVFQPTGQHMRQSSLPNPTIEPLDDEFTTMCNDTDVKFNPKQLGFIPTSYWPDKDFTFGELVREFFQRKNSSNSRFCHKLYNALRIAEHDPFYSIFLGIEWLNDRVIKIDKKVFARLLAIKTIDGSLFHQQGNFPTHGFVEVKPDNVHQFVQGEVEGLDYDNVRLLYHGQDQFNRNSREEALAILSWVAPRKRN